METVIAWAVCIFVICIAIYIVVWIIQKLLGGIVWILGVSGNEHNERRRKKGEIRNKREAARKQQELVNRYASGDLLREVLAEISADGQRPHEIRIYNNRIEGFRAGRTTVYDFAEHQVYNLEDAFAPGREWEELLVKPQMAMAEAINRLMDGQYEVFDKADREVRIISSTCTNMTYRANYVQMKLKSIMPNRRF